MQYQALNACAETMSSTATTPQHSMLKPSCVRNASSWIATLRESSHQSVWLSQTSLPDHAVYTGVPCNGKHTESITEIGQVTPEVAAFIESSLYALRVVSHRHYPKSFGSIGIAFGMHLCLKKVERAVHHLQSKIVDYLIILGGPLEMAARCWAPSSSHKSRH